MTDVGRINGATINISLGFDSGNNLNLSSISLAPTFAPPTGPADRMVPADGAHPAAVLGISAAGAIGTGMLIRALQPGQEVATPRDLLLDGLVGLQLGSGLIGHPHAESFFLGGVFSLPLQAINRSQDPDWDWRVGMLTQGGLAMLRDELGTYPMPFDGLQHTESGRLDLAPAELLGNAATEIGFDALYYGLGNSLAALMQGRFERIGESALIGAGYGGGTTLLTNLIMGAPIQPPEELITEGAAMVAEHGGADVSEMIDRTTFRAGGLFESFEGGRWAITLGRNVWMGERLLGRADVYGHELVHRDQIAGSRGASGPGLAREGHGVLSFYGQYLFWSATHGYGTNPYEREAYFYAEGSREAAYTEGRPLGDLLGAPLLLGTFILGSTLMSRRGEEEEEPTRGENEEAAAAPSGDGQ